MRTQTCSLPPAIITTELGSSVGAINSFRKVTPLLAPKSQALESDEERFDASPEEPLHDCDHYEQVKLTLH